METPPGQVFQRDFRQHPGSERPEQPSRPIKLLQWNIERGYQLAGIIEELRRIDADIISLQEVDVGCDRSGGADTGVAIAQALGLNYAFFCEFEELRSPLRDARSQGGGVHGNAILSKWPFSELAVVRHRRFLRREENLRARAGRYRRVWQPGTRRPPGQRTQRSLLCPTPSSLFPANPALSPPALLALPHAGITLWTGTTQPTRWPGGSLGGASAPCCGPSWKHRRSIAWQQGGLAGRVMCAASWSTG